MSDYVQYPEGHVLLRDLHRVYPVVSHGKGPYLYDKAGKKYFDAVGGAFVASVGHGNSKVVKAISKQLSKVSYVNGMQFTSKSTEKLASRLAKKAKGLGLDRVGFLSSGSEAIEAAVKFCRQLWVERGKSQKYKLIARTPGYHGNTLYALSASGRPRYKKLYGPILQDITFVSAPYEYRSGLQNYPTEGAEKYAKELEEVIQREGADTIAALIVEPVIGSSAAGAVPPQRYFEKIQEICRKHQILIIADEVLCGSGRTGKFYASEHFMLQPDVLVLGKGIGGGYIPLSAILVREDQLTEMKGGVGGFMHAQTYLHVPSITSAGNAVLDYFEKNKVLENVTRLGKVLQSELRSQILTHPHVGWVDGMGLLAGIEFVKEKVSKTPFERDQKVTERFIAYCFERGLILWPNTGHIEDRLGDLVMIAPPLNITSKQLHEMLVLLKNCLEGFEF